MTRSPLPCDLEVPKEARSVGGKFQLDNSHIRLVPAIVWWPMTAIAILHIFITFVSSKNSFTQLKKHNKVKLHLF